ncbi:uncharacterized protein LOC135476665 [Liolophura sinensis]|uniref:uncharacterized protein LOC135476665 n=1 Tax=Liolophura sinensis TaxID=3198878 RepID=UPI00315965BA
MEDWVKDFLEWSPAPSVRSRRSVRRESRRRSLRLLKRQSIDTFPESESEGVDVQEKLNVLNSIENLSQKRESNSPSFSESAYGTVWVAFDSCSKTADRPSGKRRLSSTKCEVNSSCQENSLGVIPHSTEQYLDTLGDVSVDPLIPLCVSQSAEKPKTSRRKSSYKKRRSFALSVPPIQEFEAEEDLDLVPPEISSDLSSRKQNELLAKCSKRCKAKTASGTEDCCDEENPCDIVPSVDQPYSGAQDGDPLESLALLSFPQSCEKPKTSRRKSSYKKRRSFALSVPPIQELEAELDTPQLNGDNLEKDLDPVSLDSCSETRDKSSGKQNKLYSESSDKCEAKAISDTEDACNQENAHDVLSSVDQPYSSTQQEDLLDLLAPLPSFSAKVKSLRRKSLYKKRRSFVLSVPPILELETKLDSHQTNCDKENVPEFISNLGEPYLSAEQKDQLDFAAPLSAFVQSSVKTRALRRKSSYKKSQGFAPSVPSIEELETELNSSEEKCGEVGKDFNTCRSSVRGDFVGKEKCFCPLSENPKGHKSAEAFSLSGSEVDSKVTKITGLPSPFSASSNPIPCDELYEPYLGSFSSCVLTEKCADSSPETCRSSTPESQLRHMHRFLSPDKSLDCKSAGFSGNLLFNDITPPGEAAMDQVWVNASDLEHLLHNQTLERKMTVQSPEETTRLMLSAEQMEVSSPCSSQLNSNLSLDCVEMGVTSALDDPVFTNVTGSHETSEGIGISSSDTGKDTIMDTSVNPGIHVDLPKTLSVAQVNMDLQTGDSPLTELSPPAVILVMGSGGDTFGLDNPGGSSDPPQLYTSGFSESPVELSPISNPLPNQSLPITQLTAGPILQGTESESQQLKEPRKRKRLLEQISQDGIILEDPQEPGQSRRSTRMRRKSVEFFSNPQAQPRIQDSSSSGEILEGAISQSTSEQTEPKKKKRKTKKTESIEDIYLNKNFKNVVDKMYETIYEDPERGIGQRRQRRSIVFDTFVVHPAKVKRRAQKAAKFNGGAAARKKRAVSRAFFDKKMASLEEELGELDST